MWVHCSSFGQISGSFHNQMFKNKCYQRFCTLGSKTLGLVSRKNVGLKSEKEQVLVLNLPSYPYWEGLAEPKLLNWLPLGRVTSGWWMWPQGAVNLCGEEPPPGLQSRSSSCIQQWVPCRSSICRTWTFCNKPGFPQQHIFWAHHSRHTRELCKLCSCDYYPSLCPLCKPTLTKMLLTGSGGGCTG